MIIPQMTDKEICNAVLSEKAYVKRKIGYCREEMARIARKQKRFPLNKTFTCRTPERKTEFTIRMRIEGKQYIDNPAGSIYALYDRPEGKYVVLVENDWTQVTIFPPHFLHRYKERSLKVNDIPIKDLITSFIDSFDGYCDIWIDENQKRIFALNEDDKDEPVNFVGACHLGLIFGKTERIISVAKTLVTYDMLYEEQYPLFDKLISEFDKQYGSEMTERLHTK